MCGRASCNLSHMRGHVPRHGSSLRGHPSGGRGALKSQSLGQPAEAGNKWGQQPDFRACTELIRSRCTPTHQTEMEQAHRLQVHQPQKSAPMPAGRPGTWDCYVSGTRGQNNDLSLSLQDPFLPTTSGWAKSSLQTSTKLYQRSTGRRTENQKRYNM